MSVSEEKKLLLSQLVDGELPLDQANRVLADVFGELGDALGAAESARQLDAMLELRLAMQPWRDQHPAESLVADAVRTEQATLDEHATVADEKHAVRSWHRWIALASAAVLGGVLVAGGFLLGQRGRVEQTVDATSEKPAIIISPEQRQEIGRAFALHESVAGPLSWYAADESTIQVAPAGKGETLREPIAIVLRLKPDTAGSAREAIPPKTYVIVCRNDDPATIELPYSMLAQKVHLRLMTKTDRGDVRLQYAIAADGAEDRLGEGVLAGSRCVASTQTSLGQLAVNNRLIDVDASAWVLKN